MQQVVVGQLPTDVLDAIQAGLCVGGIMADVQSSYALSPDLEADPSGAHNVIFRNSRS